MAQNLWSAAGVIGALRVSCCLLIFFKLTFSKNAFSNTIRMSNSLDSDQDRPSVGPDLDLNCLQRLPADDKRKELMPHPCHEKAESM